MSNVICSCTLGENARVRLQLSRMLHREIESIYGETGSPSVLCEIELKCCRREFYENRSGEVPVIGQGVVVEADGGYDYGIVYSTGVIAEKKLKLKGLDAEREKIPGVVRPATSEDEEVLRAVRMREPGIREICRNKIRSHALDMKLVDVELRMDQQKVTVFYTAVHRVDFRTLVRDLASEFKARIQMVQITTREEARRANSFGVCGCMLCCSSWIQKIHSNPFAERQHTCGNHAGDTNSHNVIGQCNRPKCCLNYSRSRKGGREKRQNGYPPIGSRVATVNGTAVIESIDSAKQEIVLRYPVDDTLKRLSLNEFTTMFVKK